MRQPALPAGVPKQITTLQSLPLPHRSCHGTLLGCTVILRTLVRDAGHCDNRRAVAMLKDVGVATRNRGATVKPTKR
jgi:hypothetical protein